MKEAYKCSLGLMLALALVGGLACCDGGGGDNSNSNPVTTVVGSGNIVQETRSVSGAMGVHLSGVANLTIEQGAPEELILQTDDNLMALILTDVQNGILVISKDPTVSLRPSRSQGTGIEAHLTLSSIDSITLSGVGGITVPDLTTTQLELTLSGVGDIEISNLDAETSDVLISGLGGISVLAGQVDDQIIALRTFNASGDYDAENLSSTTVDAEIAGSGSVRYHGSPVVTRTGNGSGRVVQLSP